jgi:hypothetical protein
LTVRQLDRLRYVAACGPVFRSADDEDLERLQLVRPFNGMPSVVEATTHTAGSELARENIQGAVAALLDACQDALRQFSKGDWCRHGYGCDDCDGCQRYRNLEVAVDAAEPGGLHALHPNWAGERV